MLKGWVLNWEDVVWRDREGGERTRKAQGTGRLSRKVGGRVGVVSRMYNYMNAISLTRPAFVQPRAKFLPVVSRSPIHQILPTQASTH